MTPQIEKLITELATKLGTTAEHLWGVLVKQAPIEAAVSLGIILAVWSLTALLSFFTWKTYNKGDGDSDMFCPLIIISVILGIISLIVTGCTMGVVFSGFLNPEYWAIKQLI